MAFGDRKKEFNKYCKPLLTSFLQECDRRSFPTFVTTCVSDENNVAEYDTDGVMTGSRGIKLSNDMILKHMLLQSNNGTRFDVVPHTMQAEIDEKTIDEELNEIAPWDDQEDEDDEALDESFYES